MYHFCPRLVVHLLEVVDGCFSTFVSQEEMPRQSALDAATSLMTSAMPSSVQHQAQALLATLHPSKMSYHSHKVCNLICIKWFSVECQMLFCNCFGFALLRFVIGKNILGHFIDQCTFCMPTLGF